MKKKRKAIGIIVILFIIISLLLIGILYFLVMSGAVFSLMPDPPAPEITYGEFPINVIYEINGETKVIYDTVICKFDGVESLGSAGKYRKWISYLKSGNKRLVLLRGENSELIFEISVSYGIPDYYMGDFRKNREDFEKLMADDRYLGYTQWENGVPTGYSITKEEVWEKYKLKVIDIQYSQPIQNSFH